MVESCVAVTVVKRLGAAVAAWRLGKVRPGQCGRVHRAVSNNKCTRLAGSRVP